MKKYSQKKLAEEIHDAFMQDPLYDLAQKLYDEGYREEDLNYKLLAKTCEEPAICTLRNHLRDITRIAKEKAQQ
jgi:5'-3' exonuclease